jgi:hypothetical protein
MFGFLKKTTKPDFSEIRELLFGDVSLSDWKAGDAEAERQDPWSTFEAARARQARGDAAGAVEALRRILTAPNLETRHYLQAWYFLKHLGVSPAPGEAKQVLGVVLEVHLKAGLDTLATYTDRTARYLNHGGRAIVLERGDPRMAPLVDDVLRTAQPVADAIGPWEEPRRGPPPKHHVRINLLTPSGLHFGEGPFSVLSEDAMGGPVISAATRLMTALIERAERTP